MLTEMMSGKVVTIPERNEQELDAVLAQLTTEQIQAMEDELNRRADAIGNSEDDFTNSSWVPGTDWQLTVFEPLYDACEEVPRPTSQEEYAGFMFGWLMRRVMIARPDEWQMFKHHQPTERIPRGTYYCRANRVRRAAS
jgi:hypothetical protein